MVLFLLHLLHTSKLPPIPINKPLSKWCILDEIHYSCFGNPIPTKIKSGFFAFISSLHKYRSNQNIHDAILQRLDFHIVL